MEVIVHMLNEDPILADMEAMPDPAHNSIYITNPRRRDGRPVHYITQGATGFIFPMTRITFIEIMEAEKTEEVVEFFRE
ncbi:MAG: hypothetical protein GX597_00055 [Anaerolineaceae bacterium]|nr:hypothetical protein [Anaerolineaceae bacterium]